jgi:hypothetical protein
MSDRSDRGHRLLLETTARRWWVALTAAIAVGIPWLLAFTLPAAERTFAAVNAPTQMLISVITPFVGLLLATDVRLGRAKVGPAVRVAYLFAVVAGAWGAVFSAVASAATVSSAPDVWAHAATAAAGGLAVQTVATSTGLGLGALLRRPIVAGVATFAPLVVGLILTAVPAVAAWVTPAVNGPLLLSGADPMAWVREGAVLLIWGGGYWVAGAGRILFPRARQLP